MSFLKVITQKIGIDKSIAYSAGARIFSGVAGILSAFFITTFLTGVEQGFYFTFGSLLSMQIFFELGLTSLMTQFVAHETSHLTLTTEGEYVGNEYNKSRLASLVRFCFNWFFIIAFIVLIFLLVLGFIYFDKFGNKSEEVEWRIPWILVSIATAIKLFQSPFISILSGMGKIKEMSEIVFFQQVILPLSIWGGLAIGLKLYVLGIGYLASVIIWQLYVHIKGFDKVLFKLSKINLTDKVSYIKEIFPLQWKISISWVSGYFISQFFNPVLFATDGPVVAGQMGMTLSALAAIQGVSLSWLNTKVPIYSQLIATGDYKSLDVLFSKTLKQMYLVCISLICAFFALMFILNITQFRVNGNVLADRFLDLVPLLLMTLPILSQQFLDSWGTYLRCHKQEPYYILSVVGGISCCVSTLVFGNLYGLYGITIGYCTIKILSLPWGYYIYKNKKREWHE